MFVSQIDESGYVRLKEFNKMKKFALYSILSALMLSALVLGCNQGNGGGNTPENKSPLVGVWEVKSMAVITFPGDCPKDPMNPMAGVIPQAQPYYYLTSDGKAHYAIKDPNGNLFAKKPAYDYKIEGNKVTIGTMNFTFEIKGNDIELKLEGESYIKATKVEKPIGADIVAAPAIQ